MLPCLARRVLLTAAAPWGAYLRRPPRKTTGFSAFTVMTRVAVAVAVAVAVVAVVIVVIAVTVSVATRAPLQLCVPCQLVRLWPEPILVDIVTVTVRVPVSSPSSPSPSPTRPLAAFGPQPSYPPPPMWGEVQFIANRAPS